MAVVRNSLEKIEEVQKAAEKLHLSKDVRGWSREDVQKWILWAIREFYSLCLDLLEIDGRELSRLKLSEFSRRVPDLATYFYNELQIWKQALDPDHNESIFVATVETEAHKTEELPTYVSQLSQSPNSSPWRNEEPESPEIVAEEEDEDIAIDTTRSSSLSFEQMIPSPPPKAAALEPLHISMPRLPQEPVVITPDSIKAENRPSISPIGKLPKTAPPILDGGGLRFPYSLIAGLPHAPILSPHIMSHGQRPSLIIPQHGGLAGMHYAGFQVPYPVSPALLPQSPFGSPLISPDIRSPALLPHMDTLKENIMRLEQHRQHQHLKLLEHQNSQEYGNAAAITKQPTAAKRRRKRRSIKESAGDNNNGLPLSGDMLKQQRYHQLQPEEEVRGDRKTTEKVQQQHIPISTPQQLAIESSSPRREKKVFSKAEEAVSSKRRHVLSPPGGGGGVGGTVGQSIHPAVAEFLMRQNSQSEAFEHLHNNNNVLLGLKRQLSALSDGEKNSTEAGEVGRGGIRSSLDESLGDESRSAAGKSSSGSVTVIRQHSHEIPYYQATSLEPGSLDNNSKEKFTRRGPGDEGDEDDDMDGIRHDSDNFKARKFEQFNLAENTTTTALRREVCRSLSRTQGSSSGARDSYSPISSPSDTEVDLRDREIHPHHAKFIHDYNSSENNIMRDSASPSTSSLVLPSYSPTQTLVDQNPHHLALPSLIPTVISGSSAGGANNANTVEVPSLLPQKTPHKKRGRPPGTKMLARPLGPSDIHAGMFRANHLWKFLLEMLEQPQQFGASIQWLDRMKGVFKIVNSADVASMWGKRKNNGKMTYDKFSRSIRQYYKKGIIIKTKPSKLIYQFGIEYFNPNLE